MEFYPIKHPYGREEDVWYSQRKMTDFIEENRYAVSECTGHCYRIPLSIQFVYNSE